MWEHLSGARARERDGYPSFISFQEMAGYCEMRGIRDQELRDWVLDLIWKMDQMYVPAVRAHVISLQPKK